MKRPQKEATTWAVLAALRGADDFLSEAMIEQAVGRLHNRNQIKAALFHLRSHRCADVVVNADGTGWWYALPPELDTRIKSYEEVPAHVTRPNRKSRRRKP